MRRIRITSIVSLVFVSMTESCMEGEWVLEALVKIPVVGAVEERGIKHHAQRMIASRCFPARVLKMPSRVLACECVLRENTNSLACLPLKG